MYLIYSVVTCELLHLKVTVGRELLPTRCIVLGPVFPHSLIATTNVDEEGKPFLATTSLHSEISSNGTKNFSGIYEYGTIESKGTSKI